MSLAAEQTADFLDSDLEERNDATGLPKFERIAMEFREWTLRAKHAPLPLIGLGGNLKNEFSKAYEYDEFYDVHAAALRIREGVDLTTCVREWAFKQNLVFGAKNTQIRMDARAREKAAAAFGVSELAIARAVDIFNAEGDLLEANPKFFRIVPPAEREL